MPVRVEQGAPAPLIAAERVYRDAEGNLVAEDDPKRVALVAAAGTPVPEEYRAAYEARAAEEQPEEAAAEEKPATSTASTNPAAKPDPGAAPVSKK